MTLSSAKGEKKYIAYKKNKVSNNFLNLLGFYAHFGALFNSKQ